MSKEILNLNIKEAINAKYYINNQYKLKKHDDGLMNIKKN